MMDPVNRRIIEAYVKYPTLKAVPDYGCFVDSEGHVVSMATGKEMSHCVSTSGTIVVGVNPLTLGVAHLIATAFKPHNHEEGRYVAVVIDRSKPLCPENIVWSNNPGRWEGQVGHKEGQPRFVSIAKWWNNGKVQTRAIECPGEGWVRGRIISNFHKASLVKSGANRILNIQCQEVETPNGVMPRILAAWAYSVSLKKIGMWHYTNTWPDKLIPARYYHNDKSYWSLDEMAEDLGISRYWAFHKCKKGINGFGRYQ